MRCAVVVGEELSEQLSPKSNSPGQETLLRIAREENYRERKALQAKYQQAAQAEEVEEDIEEDLFPCVEEDLDDDILAEEEEVELCSMLDTMQGQLFVTARAGLYLDEDAVLDGNGAEHSRSEPDAWREVVGQGEGDAHYDSR